MNQIKHNNLINTRKQLLNEITLLGFEELNKAPESNSWSVAQVCHHLYLAEKSFTKAIINGLKQSNSKKIEPRPIHRISDRSKKVAAPSIVIPSEEPFNIHQIIELLNESRTSLLDVLSSLEDESILTEKSVMHPLFGEIPLNQLIELIYLHELRHIEQIKEIKSITL